MYSTLLLTVHYRIKPLIFFIIIKFVSKILLFLNLKNYVSRLLSFLNIDNFYHHFVENSVRHLIEIRKKCRHFVNNIYELMKEDTPSTNICFVQLHYDKMCIVKV